MQTKKLRKYLGSTTDPFCYPWNNYKDHNKKAERGAEYLQADLLEHFGSNGHKSYQSISLIDKTDDPDHTRREEYSGKVLKTVSPYGLNTVT